jgi:DNA-binding NtrC family response regulator
MSLTRILFVDDEQRVLDGLRRMLRTMRAEWEMEFACDGLSALETLDKQAFDVIVTDMRMPEMDGSVLLSEVLAKHPALLRVALSGQSDMESKVCASGLVHSYLSKPCPMAELTGTVKGLLHLTYARPGM